jgi:chromosome segregation ATPase
LDDKKAEVEDLSAQIVTLSKVEELFRALMDALVLKQVRAIEKMVTEGLQTIFHDQDLRFEAEVSVKHSKISIDFYFRQGREGDPLTIRGKPLDSFGGGPTSVASLLLRVLALLRLKKFPLLLLDETLAAVSDEYTEKTGQFLRALSTKMGVPLLMITHKPAYLDHATRAYRCSEVTSDDGVRQLQLKRAS